MPHNLMSALDQFYELRSRQPSRPAQIDVFSFQIRRGKQSDSDGVGAILPRNLIWTGN